MKKVFMVFIILFTCISVYADTYLWYELTEDGADYQLFTVSQIDYYNSPLDLTIQTDIESIYGICNGELMTDETVLEKTIFIQRFLKLSNWQDVSYPGLNYSYIRDEDIEEFNGYYLPTFSVDGTITDDNLDEIADATLVHRIYDEGLYNDEVRRTLYRNVFRVLLVPEANDFETATEIFDNRFGWAFSDAIGAAVGTSNELSEIQILTSASIFWQTLKPTLETIPKISQRALDITSDVLNYADWSMIGISVSTSAFENMMRALVYKNIILSELEARSDLLTEFLTPYYDQDGFDQEMWHGFVVAKEDVANLINENVFTSTIQNTFCDFDLWASTVVPTVASGLATHFANALVTHAIAPWLSGPASIAIFGYTLGYELTDYAINSNDILKSTVLFANIHEFLKNELETFEINDFEDAKDYSTLVNIKQCAAMKFYDTLDRRFSQLPTSFYTTISGWVTGANSYENYLVALGNLYPLSIDTFNKYRLSNFPLQPINLGVVSNVCNHENIIVADFEYEVSLATVNFYNTSLGAFDSWDWSFGDGATSTGQSPIHSYTQPGDYTVSLTVSNGIISDTKTIEITITIGEDNTNDNYYLEIGDGTNYNWNIPISNFIHYSWSTYILTSEQIGYAININEIQFNVSLHENYFKENQQIYMKLITEDEVLSAYPAPSNNGFTLVYDGSVTWDESGWQGVMLDTEFSYDGTSNLQILWENNQGDYDHYSSYIRFLGTDTIFNISCSNEGYDTFPSSAGWVETFLPNTRLGFYEEGIPSYPIITSPTNYSVNNGLESELVWSYGNNTEFIRVYLSGNEEDVKESDLSSLIFDGNLATSFHPMLENASIYYWKVVASNSNSQYTASTDVYRFFTNYDIIESEYPCSAPQNVEAMEIQNNIQITWDPVTLDINGNPINPDYYNIFMSDYSPNGSFEMIGATTNNYYTLTEYPFVPDKAFFKVSVKKESIVNNDPNFILVPGGTFIMGDEHGLGYSNELPTHQVTLSSFYISKYELTQAEYQVIMATNPSYGIIGDNYPVNYVPWIDAVEYCNARSIQQGLTPCYNTTDWSCNFTANGYRLPTEAEWEYAARGATNDPNYVYAGSNDLESVAWYNTGSHHIVGTKSPNSLGIYDMSGNAWEWCNDWYGNYSSVTQTNPVGPATGSARVFRGGSRMVPYGFYCRIAYRAQQTPIGSNGAGGVRLVRRAE